jgi:hypothetical protein
MYASVRRPFVIDSAWFRWLARASAAVLVSTWIVFILAEGVRARFEEPATSSLYQVATLVIVFVGYAIGLRNELAGGATTILGTIAYFVVNRVTVGIFPPLGTVLFTAPGLLYLLAWYSDKARGASRARQP